MEAETLRLKEAGQLDKGLNESLKEEIRVSAFVPFDARDNC